METKGKSNKILVFNVLLIFTVTIFVFQSCKQDEHKLDLLHEQLVNKGYDGYFDRAGRIEKTALGAFGVKDRMSYSDGTFFATFIELDEENGFEDLLNHILPIISERIDNDKIKAAEDNTVTNKNLVMIYHGKKLDDNFLRIFESI